MRDNIAQLVPFLFGMSMASAFGRSASPSDAGTYAATNVLPYSSYSLFLWECAVPRGPFRSRSDAWPGVSIRLIHGDQTFLLTSYHSSDMKSFHNGWRESGIEMQSKIIRNYKTRQRGAASYRILRITVRHISLGKSRQKYKRNITPNI
jgi:hypothetical protein